MKTYFERVPYAKSSGSSSSSSEEEHLSTNGNNHEQDGKVNHTRRLIQSKLSSVPTHVVYGTKMSTFERPERENKLQQLLHSDLSRRESYDSDSQTANGPRTSAVDITLRHVLSIVMNRQAHSTLHLTLTRYSKYFIQLYAPHDPRPLG
jgi:hypothetical protein